MLLRLKNSLTSQACYAKGSSDLKTETLRNQNLSHYQLSPESQYLDRKSARKKLQELLKHLIAFANADGGQLAIGIEDEKQGNIITGFKDGRAYPIDDFKKIDREMRDTPLDLSFEEIPVANYKGEDGLILVISVELPNIVTVDNIKYERFSRNPRIARTLICPPFTGLIQ